jgi:hypothetical protein
MGAGFGQGRTNLAAPYFSSPWPARKGVHDHSQFNPKFIRRAELACRAGFTDAELAELFDVSLSAIQKWKRQREDFRNALKVGKAEANNRVERSLYERANGYSYNAVKIFCDKNGNVTKVPYVEHVPPDTTAAIFWLKNRAPQHWRDNQQLEHVMGKYIISDKPMTEEQWARERADVIDAQPTQRADVIDAKPALPKGNVKRSFPKASQNSTSRTKYK